jgi:hypothetical protein
MHSSLLRGVDVHRRESAEGSPTVMPTDTLWGPPMSDRASGGPRLPRHLLIISRYHPGLYDYVRARFAHEDNVEVVLDRRGGRDRRIAGRTSGVERRSAERRLRPHVDVALRMESMQFVTVAPGAGRPAPRAIERKPTDRSL